MKAVRFRCPKCQAQHSAVATRAGRAFVCRTCFGPLIVPGAPEGPSTEVPTARSIPRVEAPATFEAATEPGLARERPIRIARPASPPPSAESGPDSAGAGFPKAKTRFDGRALVAAVALWAAVGLIVLPGHRQARDHQPLATHQGDAPKLIAIPEAPIEVPKPPAPEVEPPRLVDEPVVVPEPAATPDVVVRSVRPATSTDPDRPLVIRRRQTLGQEALRRQLAEFPEVGATDKTESVLVALHQVAPPARQGRSAASSVGPQGREPLRRPATADQRKNPRNSPDPGPDEGRTRSAMRVARDEGAPRDMLAMIQDRQPELASLPWRMGDECHLGRESAEDLQLISRALRTLLAQSTPQGDTRPDAGLLRAALLEEPREEEATPPSAPGQAQAATNQAATNPAETPQPKRRAARNNRPKFVVPAAIPALQQLLMAERTPVREVLVDVLGKLTCREATKGLAKLAMFDLAPEVRERALLALRGRPAEDYRPDLVAGLRYPWAPVADHAAEALVALGDRDAASDLVALLDQPDPTGPRIEVRDGKSVTVATSLVQVNHLQNCVLCHAPSGDATKDYVRGRVPDQSQPLPPPVEYYANSSPGLFVRADVTYLRQDFSVTQPVDQPGPWPTHQRYDYLITERPASRWSVRPSTEPGEYPQRESVLFALRELTGRDLGTRSADWWPEVKARPSARPLPPAG